MGVARQVFPFGRCCLHHSLLSSALFLSFTFLLFQRLIIFSLSLFHPSHSYYFSSPLHPSTIILRHQISSYAPEISNVSTSESPTKADRVPKRMPKSPGLSSMQMTLTELSVLGYETSPSLPYSADSTLRLDRDWTRFVPTDTNKTRQKRRNMVEKIQVRLGRRSWNTERGGKHGAFEA